MKNAFYNVPIVYFIRLTVKNFKIFNELLLMKKIMVSSHHKRNINPPKKVIDRKAFLSDDYFSLG